MDSVTSDKIFIAEKNAESDSASISVQQAREAYVGHKYILLESFFDACDRKGGMESSFCFPAFLFGPFWYLYRKMYAEAGIYFLAGLIITVAQFALGLEDHQGLNLVVSLGLAVASGLLGRGLYWKAVNRKLVEGKRLYGATPRALAWLQAKGGVNVWVIWVGLGFAVLYIIAIVVAMQNVRF